MSLETVFSCLPVSDRLNLCLCSRNSVKIFLRYHGSKLVYQRIPNDVSRVRRLISIPSTLEQLPLVRQEKLIEWHCRGTAGQPVAAPPNLRILHFLGCPAGVVNLNTHPHLTTLKINDLMRFSKFDLPPNLRSLKMSKLSNCINRFPDSLQILKFNRRYNDPISEWPTSLVRLDCGVIWDWPLPKLPYSLTCLKLSRDFTHDIDYLPPNLTQLLVSNEVQFNIRPCTSLTRLCVLRDGGSLFVSDDMPTLFPNVKRLSQQEFKQTSTYFPGVTRLKTAFCADGLMTNMCSNVTELTLLLDSSGVILNLSHMTNLKKVAIENYSPCIITLDIPDSLKILTLPGTETACFRLTTRNQSQLEKVFKLVCISCVGIPGHVKVQEI